MGIIWEVIRVDPIFIEKISNIKEFILLGYNAIVCQCLAQGEVTVPMPYTCKCSINLGPELFLRFLSFLKHNFITRSREFSLLQVKVGINKSMTNLPQSLFILEKSYPWMVLCLQAEHQD